VPILGFNVPEALILRSDAYSNYHGGQFSLTKRLSRGLQFNVAYTFSKSIDIMSSDPGSTAGGGKPDVPNTGFIAQGDANNTANNKGLSDFDRTHRFSTNFVYEIPTFGSNNRFLTAFRFPAFSRRNRERRSPFTHPSRKSATLRNTTDLTRGSAVCIVSASGRPNINCTAEEAISELQPRQYGGHQSLVFLVAARRFRQSRTQHFSRSAQKRLDLSIVKNTRINERMSFEVGFDLFNVFNTINFANPNNDLQDAVDFGVVTNTIGGPRVGQFRAKFRF
jgi:hypothetical protein